MVPKPPLLAFDDKGIYCAQAGVYLDPWRPVDKAIITHGHSDHARWGHQSYITHHDNVPIIRHRLGDICVTGKAWNETFTINGVTFFTTSRRAYRRIIAGAGRIQRGSMGIHRRL